MGNEFIYDNLLIRTKCKYFKVSEGSSVSFVEDISSSTATLTITPGSTAGKVSDLTGIRVCGDRELQIDTLGLPQRITQTYVILNGLKLRVLPIQDYIINIIIVDDSESRVIQNTQKTIIVVSKDDYKNPDFIKFLFFSGNLLYLKPVGSIPDKSWELRNFPKLIISGGGTSEYESTSDTIFTLRRRYNDYVIREIDYQDQLILELRGILEEYGVELVRINKEVPLRKTSYIQYQFVQTPVRALHPQARRSPERDIISLHQPIDFVLHTNDMVLFNDFRNKYINLDLLSNLTEIKATDKYGKRWTAAVKWGEITEEFNQTYQPDDNSNFAYQCQFRCDMYFYEVKDNRYNILSEIASDLESEDRDKKVSSSERTNIK